VSSCVVEVLAVFRLVVGCNGFGPFCADAAPDKVVPANATLFLNGRVKECALHCGDVVRLVDRSDVDKRRAG